MAKRAPAETKTHEEWATAKGMLPQIYSNERPPVAQAMPLQDGKGYAVLSFAHAGINGPRANPNWGRYSAARTMKQWPIGRVMTEAEFDAAVTAANEGVVLR